MEKGLVIKSTGSWYTVLKDGNIIKCRIKGKFRTKGIRTSNPVTVGDKVEYTMIPEDGTGLIHAIEKRKNYIIRKATRFHHESHLIAANVDQAFLMVTLKSPRTPLEFIDRFLLASESFFIDTKILINKCDITPQHEIEAFIEIYERAGYQCHSISVKENIGIEELHVGMHNQLTLISGNSGVGKSSFINAIDPKLNLKTSEISESHNSGKHTTTFSEIFALDNDCYVVDTPGLKSFGIIDIEKAEIGHFFKEIFHASKNCRFNNCTHMQEPGCSVREAVEQGDIAATRYKSYVNIYLDDGDKHRVGF